MSCRHNAAGNRYRGSRHVLYFAGVRAGRRRALAGGRRQMEAEEDGAEPLAMVVEEDGVEPSAIAIRCGECHMRTHTSQDGAGPSTLVIPRGECHQRTPLVVDIRERERERERTALDGCRGRRSGAFSHGGRE